MFLRYCVAQKDLSCVYLSYEKFYRANFSDTVNFFDNCVEILTPNYYGSDTQILQNDSFYCYLNNDTLFCTLKKQKFTSIDTLDNGGIAYSKSFTPFKWYCPTSSFLKRLFFNEYLYDLTDVRCVATANYIQIKRIGFDVKTHFYVRNGKNNIFELKREIVSDE